MPTSITSSGITFNDTTTLTTGVLTAANIASGAVTPVKLSQPFTLATSVASTSGTSIDFTGIPSWVKRITVMLNGVSTNANSSIIVQIGSGSFATSGYSSTIWSDVQSIQNANGFIVFRTSAAANNGTGAIQFSLVGSNIWVQSGSVAYGNTASIGWSGAGNHSGLAGTLDRIRLTTVNGSDSFDAGSVNIIYEG